MSCEVNGTNLEFGFDTATDLRIVLVGAYDGTDVKPGPMSYEIIFPEDTPTVYYCTWLELASEWIESSGESVAVTAMRPAIRFDFKNVGSMAFFASEVEAGTMNTIVCDELDARGVPAPSGPIPDW
ncbi:MAG: hypothetical protein AAFN41_09325 [Planctomycetota bacterium]